MASNTEIDENRVAEYLDAAASSPPSPPPPPPPPLGELLSVEGPDAAALVPVTATDEDEYEYPEGGLRAWLVVAGSFLVYFASFGVVNSFGFFQTFYQTSYLQGYSATAISFIGTLQITIMYLSGSIAGALFDAYGLKWLYPLAALGGAGSLLATSFIQPNAAIWQQFLAQSLVFGLTVAYGVQPALTVTGQYFKRRRALAMGVVASGSSVGGVCLPILFSRLIPTIGFPWAMRVGALVLLVCYALAMVLSGSRPRSRRPSRKLKSFTELLDYRGFLDVRYACLSFGALVSTLGIYVPLYYIESYCTIIDPDTKVTSYLLPLINGLSLFGRIIGGHAADKFGRLNILYPMVTLSGILCLAVWLPSTTSNTLIVFACLYGFVSGIFISVMPAATAQITPTEKLGARLGAFGTVTSVAFLTGSPTAGALIKGQTREGYQPLIAFAGSCLLAGGAIIFVARLLHNKSLRSKW